jgi:rhodanese-related sulfurtransferase
MLVDVRPTVEYVSAHIPGAVSIPLEELRVRMEEIPVGIDVVTYCRSSHCLLSREAVWLISAHGRCARPLEEGMLEWRLQRLPLESGKQALRRSHPIRPREYARPMASGA